MENNALPRHIAIIMDGNGRWAKQRGLPRKMGHAAGSETFRRIATYCKNLGVEYLTVYAFSTQSGCAGCIAKFWPHSGQNSRLPA